MEGSRESQGARLMPMTTISRRRFLGTVAAVAAAGAPRPARGGTAVKIGTAVLGDYSMAGPVIVALERGFFAREGLEAEFVPFRGGPDLLKAVMGGDVLVGITGSTDILVFREAGSPIKMVATHTEGNHFTLNVAPDVSSVAGLKGKAIGVTRVGATTWIFARMLAKKEGWDPDKDVQIVGLGGLDAQLAALARREIAAYVWGDGGAVTELQGKSKVLLRFDAVTGKWISQIQYASEDAIKHQADPIRRSLRALFTALKLMRESPRDAAEICSKKLGWPPEAVLRAHRISGPLLPVDGRIDVAALGVMQGTLLEYDVIKKKLPLEDHFTREFTPVRVEGKPDPDLARYVEARGYSVIGDGRLPLYAQGLYRTGPQTKPEPIPGGAPFVSFVRQGGPLGLTSPATYVRIPWTPLLANRTWLIRLGMGLPRLVRPRPATWVENLFWGHRYTISLAFNDVRGRALFPLYLENRDRVIRLADEPSQLLINFTHAEHFKIQDVFPGTATRRMSETLESTQVVSAFLERAQGATPQVLTVQFGYFTGWQSWAPVLIPMIFFVLGNLAGPLLTMLVKRVGGRLSGRIHISPRSAPVERQTGTVVSRETLGRIAPGSTTYEEVIRLCGADHEEHEEPLAPDRRILVYRGRKVVPQRRRRFGWLATVSRWDVEHHEVEITLERNVVQGVQARVRRTHLAQPASA